MSRPPTFDLVLATVGRSGSVTALLRSLQGQTLTALRVIVVDQNDDDLLGPVLADFAPLDILRLRAPSLGLSRARNLALPHLRAEIVGFPDDDCVYPLDLLERVASALEGGTATGVVGRTADPAGRPARRRFATIAGRVDRESVWRCGNSASMFLRRDLVHRVGTFDESLGLGSGTAQEQGEEIDYLIRALDGGAQIVYDPDLVVFHDDPPRPAVASRAAAARAGLTVGFLLARHRYPARTVARMLVRPAGGAVLELARLDTATARSHLATLHGRLRGYAAGRSRR